MHGTHDTRHQVVFLVKAGTGNQAVCHFTRGYGGNGWGEGLGEAGLIEKTKKSNIAMYI